MPRPKLKQTKTLIALRVSSDTLSRIDTEAKKATRNRSNFIEYIIYLYFNKETPEPIPYSVNQNPQPKKRRSKRETGPQAKISPEPISQKPEPEETAAINDTIIERPFDD